MAIGALSTDNTRMRISGLISGMDTQKIIESVVEAQLKPVKKMEDQVTLNNDKVVAINKLKTIFQELKTASENLNSLNGGVLSSKKVILSSNNTANPVNYLDVSATKDVAAQILSIKVDTVAKAKIEKTATFSDTTSSITDISGIHTAGRFTAGTFQIGTTDVTLAAGDSLSTIASKINAVSTTTKVSASIIQPTVGQYIIQLKSNETGISNAYAITDPDSVLNSVLSNVQTAADATIRINDNITITRPSNTITDFITGLTIKVYNPSADNITVDIDYDKQGATDAIVSFVEKYNNLITYVNEQQARDGDGNYLDTAKIQRNNFVSEAKSKIRAQLDTVISNNGNFYQLSSIGIKFMTLEEAGGDPTKMSLLNISATDVTKLTDAIHNNFDNVRKLFELQNTSTSANFVIRNSGNNLDGSTFSINVDVNRASNERAKITYGSTTINAELDPFDSADLTKGGMIKGPAGTPFEGFTFGYTGIGNNETTDMVVTQGVADRMRNEMKLFFDNPIDPFKTELESIAIEVTTINADIEAKKIRIEQDKNKLIEKFTKMEAAINQANSIQQMLDAQQRAMDRK
jgi:flagellar hook-associated protein 2